MRATRLFLLGLAALALTVPLGCDRHGRAQRAARAKKGHQVMVQAGRVKVVVGDAQVAAAPGGAEPQAAPPVVPGPAPAPPLEDPAAKKVRKSWEVKVWVQGRNRPEAEVKREAEEQAVERARGEVRTYLRQQSPPLDWTPSADYVRKHLVTEPARRLPEQDQPVKVAAGEFQAQRWAVPLAITEKQYQDMVRRDREARGAERMLLASEVLGGVLLLLVVVAGFLHLDDWAGGAYTRRLRRSLGFLLGKPRQAPST